MSVQKLSKRELSLIKRFEKKYKQRNTFTEFTDFECINSFLLKETRRARREGAKEERERNRPLTPSEVRSSEYNEAIGRKWPK